jgi:hypothetical protein
VFLMDESKTNTQRGQMQVVCQNMEGWMLVVMCPDRAKGTITCFIKLKASQEVRGGPLGARPRNPRWAYGVRRKIH